ncbi:uncharacterized protein BXZ73DRAFT_77866 [Epithele typhae]|uniref:uncharacterized protein n=1 Tax=Epithele typhae TaxID=378194 RepID=UPI00200813DB|nr:uncharacterized protein BXZ73DRAFT_77866 [Epithele typhae]KAH9930415.1 hypothetical protein BXZ73DRAFT_77866 [Epithele typhae]
MGASGLSSRDDDRSSVFKLRMLMGVEPGAGDIRSTFTEDRSKLQPASNQRIVTSTCHERQELVYIVQSQIVVWARWPSGLRRQTKDLVRKGATLVIKNLISFPLPNPTVYSLADLEVHGHVGEQASATSTANMDPWSAAAERRTMDPLITSTHPSAIMSTVAVRKLTPTHPSPTAAATFLVRILLGDTIYGSELVYLTQCAVDSAGPHERLSSLFDTVLAKAHAHLLQVARDPTSMTKRRVVLEIFETWEPLVPTLVRTVVAEWREVCTHSPRGDRAALTREALEGKAYALDPTLRFSDIVNRNHLVGVLSECSLRLQPGGDR